MISKKDGFTAIAILLMIAISFYLSMQLWPKIENPLRHVNPKSEVEKFPFPSYMILMIKSIFDNLIKGNYTTFKEELTIFMETHVPDRYRYVMERFHQLLEKISGLLADVENLIERAEHLLNIGEDIRAILNEASIKLTYANITYLELKSASEELARSFSLPLIELQEKLNEIAKKIELLNDRIKKLMELLEEREILKETFITIEVEPKKVWTGGIISIEGRLFSEDANLIGRIVEIYMDGVKVIEGITMENGYFKVQLKLPYIYKPIVSIQACYSAKGLDSQIYKPSISNIVEIEIIYIKPKIIAEAIGEALPGKSFSIMGRIEAEIPLPHDYVKILWNKYEMRIPLNEGKFYSLIKIPENMEEGRYPLVIELPSYEIYASAREVLYVNVKKIPLLVNISFPSMVVAGIPFSIRIEPLNEEKINVRAIFAGQSYIINSSGELIISPPLNLFTANYNLEIFISSSIPWYRTAIFKNSIFVINPITFALPIGLAFSLTSKLRRRTERTLEEIPKKRIEVLEEKRFVPLNLKWLLELYWKAVNIVSRLTGIIMKPSMTMREYLKAVNFNRINKYFKVLTFAAEKAIYSKGPSEEEIQSAREAFNELNKD